MDSNHYNHFKQVPVSSFLAVLIIVIFSLYISSFIKNIPCENTLFSKFFSNFVHIDRYHLFANLFALYALSRVEKDIGSKKFLCLIIFLVFFNTIVETMLHKTFRNMPCSIGFSGVLFGIMTWELVTNQEFDLILLSSVIGMVVLPSLSNPKASLIGHVVGAGSGVIGALIWKRFLYTR